MLGNKHNPPKASRNAGIDNALKMREMFSTSTVFKTKFECDLDSNRIQLTILYAKYPDTTTPIIYKFNDDGTYKRSHR